MDTSMLPHAKPEPRKRTKARADRQEAQIKKLTRAACVIRDGYCRYHESRGDYMSQADLDAWDISTCRETPSEWAHFGDKRRSRTRGQQPEIRHTTAGSLMLCQMAHAAYDKGRLKITALTRHGCDGRLKFRWAK